MILLLILPLIAVALIIYFLYWFIKEYCNSHKIGIRVAQVLTFVVIGFIAYWMMARESEFFKCNIVKTLQENQLDLTQDFKTISHHHQSVMTNQHGFTLEISNKDKLGLSDEIKYSKYFRQNLPENFYFEWNQIKDPKINTIIIDLETPQGFIREIYKRPYGQVIITVSKNTNELTCESGG